MLITRSSARREGCAEDDLQSLHAVGVGSLGLWTWLPARVWDTCRRKPPVAQESARRGERGLQPLRGGLSGSTCVLLCRAGQSKAPETPRGGTRHIGSFIPSKAAPSASSLIARQGWSLLSSGWPLDESAPGSSARGWSGQPGSRSNVLGASVADQSPPLQMHPSWWSCPRTSLWS